MSLLTSGPVRFVPSIHQRTAFALEVRRAWSEFKPDCVAIEMAEGLSGPFFRGVLRLPQVSLVCHPSTNSEGEMIYVPIDPCDSVVEAARLALEADIPIHFLDAEPAAFAPPLFLLPDDFTVERAGLERYLETVLPYIREWSGKSGESEREAIMAARLADLARKHERILCVLGLAHFEEVKARFESLLNQTRPKAVISKVAASKRLPGAFLSHVHPDSIPETLREIPGIAAEYEKWREAQPSPSDYSFDKLDSIRALFKRAERTYRDEYKSEVSIPQFKALFQFTRNLALVAGRLQPDLYELVIGAKGAVDGDYGYEVYRTAREYPYQTGKPDQPEDGSETDEDANQGEAEGLPTVRLKNDRGSFTDRDERYRMLPSHGNPEMEKVRFHFRRRPPLEMQQQWKEQWDKSFHHGICSWPPEDERQEKFMMFIRRRALERLTSDRRQVLEFTNSFLDGLDLRETTRRWHERKVFVHQTPQPQGKVGAVVLIFEDEPLRSRRSWRNTLYAENQNESDISFFATPPGDRVVGPRISLTEFKGILSIYPATGIPDIWSYPGIAAFEWSSEALIAGAILFSPDRFIAYVAPRAPTGIIRELASRMGKALIHLPLKSFTEGQLRKVRRFHLLDGRDVRAFASEYIFDE